MQLGFCRFFYHHFTVSALQYDVFHFYAFQKNEREEQSMRKLGYLLLSVLSLVLIPDVASAIGQVVPEPTSLFLIMAGLLGIFGLRRIFKK
jgi:hypothetical protein